MTEEPTARGGQGGVMRVVRLRAPGGPEQPVVEEAGPGAGGVAAGDEVFALTPFDRDGVAADYTVLPAELLVARPRTLRHADSAAIPLPALTAMEPVDLVFDTVGGERLRRSVAVVRASGRRVSVTEEPPGGGEYFAVEPDRDELTSIARLVDAGDLRPPAVDTFPLASAREAFERSLEPRPRGKVVLVVV